MSSSRTLGGKNQTPLSGRSSGKRKRPRDRAVLSQTGSQKTRSASSSLHTPRRDLRALLSGRNVGTQVKTVERKWRGPGGRRGRREPLPRSGGPGGRGVALSTLSGRRGPPRPPHHRPHGPSRRLGGAPARGLRERLSGARGSRRTSQHLLDVSSESCSCDCSPSARVWTLTFHQITQRGNYRLTSDLHV